MTAELWTPEQAALAAAVGARAEELTALLTALVQAPSLNPPGDTRAAVDVVRGYLDGSGLNVRVSGADAERLSVIARWGEGSPRLLFLSHLDTVPLGRADAWNCDPFGATIRDGRLYGRGAADAKGSAAAMLVALRTWAATGLPLPGSVAVALVADEETGGAGAQHLLEQGALEADAVVVGETTDNRVAIAEKGVAWLRLRTHGRTAHASVPHAGVNAAALLVRWLARVEERLAPRLRERRHPLVSPPTLSLGTLAGGIAPNVVPDQAEALVDRRTLPGETLEDARNELLAELRGLDGASAGLDPDVELLVWADPFETDPSSAVARAALAACRALGLPAEPVGYQQASDGRFFGARGVPTLVLGPGVAEGTHVPNESVALDQAVQAATLHALTTHQFLTGQRR